MPLSSKKENFGIDSWTLNCRPPYWMRHFEFLQPPHRVGLMIRHSKKNLNTIFAMDSPPYRIRFCEFPLNPLFLFSKFNKIYIISTYQWTNIGEKKDSCNNALEKVPYPFCYGSPSNNYKTFGNRFCWYPSLREDSREKLKHLNLSIELIDAATELCCLRHVMESTYVNRREITVIVNKNLFYWHQI